MKIGFIGGSGLYEMEGTSGGESLVPETPYGKTSGEIFSVKIGEHQAFFLPRHGKGHTLLPSEVPYQANLFALKQLGVTHVISISAVGSLREDVKPGEFVLPDQYIDCTRGERARTYFGGGVVAHTHFADPTCKTTRNHVAETLTDLGYDFHLGGTYVCIEGPQFSTRAESHLYRSWNSKEVKISVIGMTAMPEARLARELGLCYQTVATATDYDCWNEAHGDVSVEAILKTLRSNVKKSQNLITHLLSKPFPPCRLPESDLIKNAVVTQRELWPAKKQALLETILS